MSEQKNDAFIEQRESIAAIVAERDEINEKLHQLKIAVDKASDIIKERDELRESLREAIEAMKSNEHEYEELIEKIKAKHGEMK